MGKVNTKLSELIQKAQGDRSQNQFALQCGISSAAITRITSGNYSPSAKTLKKIANCAYNGVSYESLLVAAGLYDSLNINNKTASISEEEKQLIEIIQKLNAEEVKELSNYVDYIISKRK